MGCIRDIVDAKTTYGYRRVAGMMRNAARKVGAKPVNHKHVYRLMKENDLLLAKHTGAVKRPHTGKVITLRSDMRWCSDAFQVRCWDGKKLEVAFAMDCCDREVLGYVATTGFITSEMIQDLMAQSFEYRFGPIARIAPAPLEWLSDNGPPYTAHETRIFGRSLGFFVVSTPAYSPESNGAAEAFVKTFKRDYVYVNELFTAEHVLSKLQAWFEDYNNNAPRRASTCFPQGNFAERRSTYFTHQPVRYCGGHLHTKFRAHVLVTAAAEAAVSFTQI